tara:strand:+ start:213 stop:470 length:258 start_codon:yes stop_codon:yes gene_type:complete
MPLITVSSEFLIKINKARIDEKKEVIGKVYAIRLGKLNIVSFNIILKGTSLLADFLNCSTKSPIKIIDANMIKVKKKEYRNFFNI